MRLRRQRILFDTGFPPAYATDPDIATRDGLPRFGRLLDFTERQTATGALALLLLLVHAAWATAVLLQHKEPRLRSFHRTSLTVWLIWLIPFVTGLIMGRRSGL